ncbi:hypothetical protein CPB85DRAFT_1287941 [Mucidula mucida]|nr:hypothetical protein CPB85DRAFT_1287941 [Mucidula mucida]
MLRLRSLTAIQTFFLCLTFFFFFCEYFAPLLQQYHHTHTAFSPARVTLTARCVHAKAVRQVLTARGQPKRSSDSWCILIGYESSSTRCCCSVA